MSNKGASPKLRDAYTRTMIALAGDRITLEDLLYASRWDTPANRKLVEDCMGRSPYAQIIASLSEAESCELAGMIGQTIARVNLTLRQG